MQWKGCSGLRRECRAVRVTCTEGTVRAYRRRKWARDGKESVCAAWSWRAAALRTCSTRVLLIDIYVRQWTKVLCAR